MLDEWDLLLVCCPLCNWTHGTAGMACIIILCRLAIVVLCLWWAWYAPRWIPHLKRPPTVLRKSPQSILAFWHKNEALLGLNDIWSPLFGCDQVNLNSGGDLGWQIAYTRLGIMALHSAQTQLAAHMEGIDNDQWQDYQMSQVAKWSSR